jgi:carbon storage regulator
MLVLTRKLMEKLYIGDDVCVTVVRLEGGQVRLGIEAPREIAVVRAELLDGRKAVPFPTSAPGQASTPTIDSGTSHPLPTPMSLKTRPGEARGIGIRRRGPSQ